MIDIRLHTIYPERSLAIAALLHSLGNAAQGYRKAKSKTPRKRDLNLCRRNNRPA
jgi:hypothetical protein